MKLKRQYDKQEDIPQAYLDLYVEEEGKWVRNDAEIEGIVSGDKFAEFRENNRKLNQQLVDAQKELDAAKTIKEEYEKLKNPPSPAVESDKVSQLERRVSDLTVKLEQTQKKYEEQVASVAKERDQKAADLDRYIVNTDITKAALGSGIDDHALEDVLLRAERIFRRVEGKTVAMNGTVPLYSEKHPALPLDPALWITEHLSVKAPHLFKGSSGGGASNGGRIPNTTRVISANDPLAFGKNLEDIASGKVTVQ